VNRVRKHAAAEALYVQVFDDDGSESLHRFVGFLMLKVFALIPDVLLRFLQQQNGLVPTLRFLVLATCHLALGTAKFRLCGFVKPVVGNRLAIGTSREVLQAHIQADGIGVLGQMLRLIFDRKTGIPVSGFPTNGDSCNFPFSLNPLCG